MGNETESLVLSSTVYPIVNFPRHSVNFSSNWHFSHLMREETLVAEKDENKNKEISLV